MRVFLTLLLLLAGSNNLWSQPATTETNSNFRVIAYITGGRFEYEKPILKFHINHVTDVVFAFVNPDDDASGNISPLKEKKKASLEFIVDLAHRNKKRVLIALGGWRGNYGTDPVYEKIAADEKARKNFIGQIIQLVEKYDADGIDLDWEYPRANSSDRQYATEYAKFVIELATALHSKEKILTAAVVGSDHAEKKHFHGKGYLDRALQQFDLVHLMAYDFSNAEHSTFAHAKEAIAYWIGERRLDPKKVTLGLPLYARPDWVGYRKIIQEYGKKQSQVDKYIDPTGKRDLHYNGIPTILKKVDLAIDNGLAGIMFWEIPLDVGMEDADISLMKSAFDHASKK